MKGLVFDFELYKVRIVTTSDSSRQITFYFDESKISRREGANIIRKCKKDWPFLKDGNTIVKTDCFENFYEKFEDKTDDLILLNKKRSFDGKKIKTYGKFVGFEEVKAKKRTTGEDLYIYTLHFRVPKEKAKFDSVLFSDEPLDINSKFKEGTYYVLKGKIEFNEFATKKLKTYYRHAGMKSYNFNIYFKDYPEIEIDETKFEKQEIGRNILHAHTIYSRNDAFIKFNDIKEAFKQGMLNAFAITDHRESRGFLDAQATFKGTDYKVIPGLEAEVFDDTIPGFDLNTCPRYHMVLLIKTEDSYFNYKGKDIKVNEGFKALNELITDANLKYYSEPTREFKTQQEADGEFKSSSKPLMSLKSILEYKEKGYLTIGSACIAGTVRKYWFQQDMEKFKKYFDIVDWVEIHPLHNESFTIESKMFPLIKTLDDIKNMNKKLVEFCIEHDKPFIFGDDAHVATKEDRVIRQYFKMGEIAKFSTVIKRFKDTEDEKLKKQLLDEFLKDNAEEKQPFMHSYPQMKEELLNQGFSEDIIQKFLDNEKNIAEQCPSIQDITLVPKVMITPGFPGVDLKKEIPELAWKFVIKKWSTDGTLDTVDPIIVDRVKTELKAIDAKDYEVLYYFARFLVQKSLEKGYIVGSRGLNNQTGPL